MSQAAYNLNRRIEAFIEEQQRMQVPFSKSDLAYLNRYTGYGGLAKFGAEGKGLLSEYFTPVELVEKMMGLAYQHGYVDGPVLEPSCGIGRFLHYLPKETEVDAFEINPTSWQIAKANFPDFHIFNQYFNQLFVTRTGAAKQFEAKYQLVIGNLLMAILLGNSPQKNVRRPKLLVMKTTLSLVDWICYCLVGCSFT